MSQSGSTADDGRLMQLLDRATRLLQHRLETPIELDGDNDLALLAQYLQQLKDGLRDQAAIEARLLDSLHDAAVGGLVRAAAHDLNNVLGALLNATELLAPEVPPDSAHAATAMASLRGAADRARETLGQLIDFARAGTAPARAVVDLNVLIGEVGRLCAATFGRQFALHVEPAASPARIEGSAGRLRQALTALCLRARAAMPAGGSITLAVERRDEDRAATSQGRPMPGPHFAVLVRDTGQPVPPDEARLLFTPAAPPAHAPDPLALIAAWRLIAAHQGRIDVCSQPGEGTTFAVLLPAAAPSGTATAAAAAVAPAATGRALHPGETILLIDDETPIRTVTRLMLDKLGYDVLQAATAREAIDLFRASHRSICAIMLDLILPDQAATATVDALLGIDPGARILIMSGFTRDPRIAELLLRGCQGFLEKPYNRAQLAAALADLRLA